MKPAHLLRWYPRAWRERYGEELLALIQDTLDEGRPTWRLRLGVIGGGLRERVHQAVRAGTAAAKRASTGWLLTVVVGLNLGNLPWNFKAPLPPAREWQKTAAFDALVGAFAVTGVVLLASGLVAAPAFIAFLREGGWPKIRRRVAWAAGATAAAGGGLAGLFLGQRSMSSAQLSHGAAWQAALPTRIRGCATSCSTCGRDITAVPASLRGGMILVSPTIDSVREERPGFRSGRS
jgi:hypothetical protein